MQWLVVLDPIENLIAKTDTSLALIKEGRRQGVRVDTATIDALFFKTHAAAIVSLAGGEHQERKLGDYDLIFMRKEPPYDLPFHYATQLLSLSDTLVVNSPSSLRSFNEKLIGLPFIEHMPPTLVSSSPALIGEFVKSEGECVIKALDSFQGKSVQKLTAADKQLISHFTGGGTQPVMVQKFLPRVYEGDKRVIMIGDRLLGAAMRKPRSGYHANFGNSDALKTSLTPAERRIIDKAGPWMVEQGIHFSGLDFIGERLTEINITCPTGIMQISELDGTDLPQVIVDYFIELSR